MFFVQNPVQLLQGRVQGHLVEGVVHRVPHWVLQRHLALQDFGLQAAKGGNTNNGAKCKIILLVFNHASKPW